MAEGNIHFDLTDELEQNIKTEYDNFCQDLAGMLGREKLMNELEGICTKTQYEPIVKCINDTVDLFYGDMKNKSDSIFQDWTDGDGSFVAAAKNAEAGESAETTAQNLQNAIRGKFDDFWQSQPMQNVSVDTSRPNVPEGIFDELKEIYNKYADSAKDLCGKCEGKIRGMGENNPTYNLVLPAVQALAGPIQSLFPAFAGKIEQAKNESEAKKSQMESNADSAHETASQTAETAEDIAQSLAMFQNV